MFITCVLGALLAASDGGLRERALERPSAALDVGALGAGYTATGTRIGGAHALISFRTQQRLGALAAELGTHWVAPLDADGASHAAAVGLTAGIVRPTWSLLVGGMAQWADGARPVVQWLPQLRASVAVGGLGLSLSVLDRLGLVPLRLAAEVRVGPAELSIGWIAPVGLAARASVAVVEAVAVRAEAMAFKVAWTEYALVSLGAAWRFGGS